MEFLTQTELAERLKVHINTINRWQKQGLPFLRLPNAKTIRFDWVEVRAWIESGSAGQNGANNSEGANGKN